MCAGWNGGGENPRELGLRLFFVVCDGEVKIGDCGLAFWAHCEPARRLSWSGVSGRCLGTFSREKAQPYIDSWNL